MTSLRKSLSADDREAATETPERGREPQPTPRVKPAPSTAPILGAAPPRPVP
jgi:hypothetical protein